MRMLREILRLHLELGMSARAIARSCSLSPSTVSGYLGRVKVAKLSWPLPPELDEDGALTKLLFWEEYKTEQPGGYQYSQFCERYAQWASTLNVTMRQTHRAGEKLFLDF